MNFRHSLRSRIIGAFALFAALLALLYSVTLYSALLMFEDRILTLQLREDVHAFLDRRKRGQQVAPPSGVHTKTYTAISEIPEEIRDKVAAMPPGEHEIELNALEFHVIVYQDPDTADRLFFVYDVSNLELSQLHQHYIAVTLGLAFIAFIAMGTLIGILLGRRIAAPMFRLAEVVRNIHPDRPPTDFANEFQDDEVGMVARRLETALERNKAFVERERRFARFASHELRTPVAVMKGALELLVGERPTEATGPLRRMENAIGEMEILIETFLMLAREKPVRLADETVNAEPLIDLVIEEHRHLLQHKDIEVRSKVRDVLTLRLPPRPLKVVLGNLVQNAFRYTETGSVTIFADENSISVIDTGVGLSSVSTDILTSGDIKNPSDQRAGVGLEIVETLCSLYNWNFVIDPIAGNGTRAIIRFGDRPGTD